MAEERKSYTQRVAMGTQGNQLVISHIRFDEDGFGAQQINMAIPIDPSQDASAMLKKAAKIAWRPTGNPNSAGFFAAEKVRNISEEELATAKQTGNRSISVTLFETEEETFGGDLVHTVAASGANPLM